MKVWRLLGEYNAETTTFSAFAGTGRSSPYTPDFSGRLVGVRAMVNRAAATSLINHVQVRLTCTTFNPNTIEVGVQGSGLQTVPVGFSGGSADWDIDQPVQAGVPITLEGRNICETDTPVTVSVLVYGLFQTGGM